MWPNLAHEANRSQPEPRLALSAAVAAASLSSSRDTSRSSSTLPSNPSAHPRAASVTPASSDAQAALLQHVPSAFRASCTPISGDTPGEPPAGTRAAATCYPSAGARETRYYDYFNTSGLREHYKFWLRPSVSPDFCKAHGERLSPREYSNATGSGQVYCVKIGDGEIGESVILIWTVSELRVVAEAHRDGRDAEALYDWWKSGEALQ